MRHAFRRILVVGAGRAGVAATEELRRLGFEGEIVVLGGETDPPYDRRSCSKGLLTGECTPKDVGIEVRAGTYVDWRIGKRAVDLDPIGQTLTVHTGEVYRYDGLVIATGCRARVPPGWPIGEPGVHTLHNLADARALRADLLGARRVVVVGGGLTGCELAYVVRSMARECVLIDAQQHLMAAALGDPVSRYVTEEIAHAGVELHLGRRVREIVPGRGDWILYLDDGTEIVTDVLVVTAGEIPNIDWLATAHGLDIDDGVLCDGSLRVVGAPSVVAAGAVARWPNESLGGQLRRCRTWITALEQGAFAAGTLLQGDVHANPFTQTPRFSADVFGLLIQVCGEPSKGRPVEMRLRPGHRNVARQGVLVSHYAGEKLVGVAAVNAPRAFTTVARTMVVGGDIQHAR